MPFLLHDKWCRNTNGYTRKSNDYVTTTAATILWHFIWDKLGEPVLEETFTHSHLSYHIINHPLSASPYTMIHSILDSLFAQHLSSLVSWVWNLPPHARYISSPSLLFVTHAHTFATHFTVVPRLCHLFLVSLSSLYLVLYLLL